LSSTTTTTVVVVVKKRRVVVLVRGLHSGSRRWREHVLVRGALRGARERYERSERRRCNASM